MLGCSSVSSLFGLSSSDPLKDSFLLYKKVTEQYRDPEILRIIRLLIPQDIILQTTTTTKHDERNIVPLLRWFKNEFMKWTPKDPVCEICANRSVNQSNVIEGSSNNGRSVATTTAAASPPIMQVKKIIKGNSWKMRRLELFVCNNCNYEYAFPRYAEILRIAETRTGRCSEWSMLFGAMLSSLGIKTRIVHDFLDHCWNEAMLSYPEGEQWVHVDSTLDYPVSLNHPYHYEQNWAKQYEYVLAFTADEVEDVTQRYTLKWEAIQQRRLKKRKTIDFRKGYSSI
ncbi:MAG: transglutaminase domain-containing protein [Nitrososphaeraceae archaeon]